MKKVWLLSAVAMGLVACGGSQDIANVDLPKVNINGNPYKVSKNSGLEGRTHGVTAQDQVLYNVSPSYRDGYISMNHVMYGIQTNPAGVVEHVIYHPNQSAPLNAGVVHYAGRIIHAGQANTQVYGVTERSYDVSAGAINLTMDFNNKTFTGKADDAPVTVVDSYRKIKTTTDATTGTIIPEITGLTEAGKMVTANRSYVLNGTINKEGYSGHVTMVEHKMDTVLNETMGGAIVSVPETKTKVTLDGTVNGHFYGPNAAETAGKINFIGNSQYNAAFGAQRTN